jgi:hypothetical protein
MDAPRLRAYPKETVVAEKLEAIVQLGLANTRMKDFYDLLVISRTFPFDGELLQSAITKTFARRGTGLPTGPPVGLTPSFSKDPGKQTQWRAFLNRSGLRGMDQLDEVVAKLADFLLPPLASASRGGPFQSRWDRGAGWGE